MLIEEKVDASPDFANFTTGPHHHLEHASLETLNKVAQEISIKVIQDKKKKTSSELSKKHEALFKKIHDYYLLIVNNEDQRYSSGSANWILDNYHVIDEQFRDIRRDLSKDFYDRLPNIISDDEVTLRVFCIADKYLSVMHEKIELKCLKTFIKEIQKSAPLTIGEIWAIVPCLRLALIKHLEPLITRIIETGDQKEAANNLAKKVIELIGIHENSANDILDAIKSGISVSPKKNRTFIVQLTQRLRDQDPEIARSMEWVEKRLKHYHVTATELAQIEHLREATDQLLISHIITSLQLITRIDWNNFFEEVSTIDNLLAQDPKGLYLKMDHQTKDNYRAVVEILSKRSQFSEIEVTKQILEKSHHSQSHVGFYLLGEGRKIIEAEINYRPTVKDQLNRAIKNRPGVFYFGLACTIFLISLISLLKIMNNLPISLWDEIILLLLVLVPLSELSLGLVNYLITVFRSPRKFPQMDYKNGIPEACKTIVVIPCLITDRQTIDELISHLELHYLANQDPNIFFALLADFKDAPTESLAEDSEIIEYTKKKIDHLNLIHLSQEQTLFSLFYRRRKFNSSENKWMGWERKRGKIEEFNQILRGSEKTSYETSPLPINILTSIKYVLTVDADTRIPIHAVRKMIGVISHPLNTPKLNKTQTRVVEGFGIIQPRISISLVSAAQSRFAQIFSGNTGLDPYTTAVSDVYQDLFDEGTFTGKGLYEVDIFEKVMQHRVPENTILSHDLFEGSFTRVALVTSIELIDDYPKDFKTFLKRNHRWTRGDWQLIPWLKRTVPCFGKQSRKNDLPMVARWKLLDNLRRSLLAPSTMGWLILSWTILNKSSTLWTMIIVSCIGLPILLPAIMDLHKKRNIPWREHIKNNLWSLRTRVEQLFLMIVYLPDLAYSNVDAIIRSLYRSFISKKKRLEWVSFSSNQKENLKHGWRQILTMAPLVSIVLALIILKMNPQTLAAAGPFLFIWWLAPYITFVTKRNIPHMFTPLREDEIKQFRRYACLTWGFFEKFIQKDFHYLAPDNFQEDPSPVMATRTSPTNIGLQLLTHVSAVDLGFIDLNRFIEISDGALSTLNKLERFQGHFLNWYDTKTLEPLGPKYISTVDSGNLAGHLITFAEACLEFGEQGPDPLREKMALQDMLRIFLEKINQLNDTQIGPRSGSLKRLIISTGKVLSKVESHNLKIVQQEFLGLKRFLNDLPKKSIMLDEWFELIESRLQSLTIQNDINPKEISQKLNQLAEAATRLASEMNFSLLFDEDRKIFVIGYNLTEGKADNSYYDLLASESRLASYIAIAKGDVSNEHWFRLNRELTSAAGSRALISWSATMFEYLMPVLVMKRYEGTLLDQTYETIVKRQIEYGFQKNAPWGVSEAGNNSRDINFNYQYAAYGIPGLGLKRGLRDEFVVSPYSTMLASMIRPRESLNNLRRLESLGALGQYGFYESLDYTKERLPKNHSFVILKSYMAHHQGMGLLAINNLLNQNILQERFHKNSRVAAIELLLQERIPAAVEISKPRSEEIQRQFSEQSKMEDLKRVGSDPLTPIPATQILSNGHSTLMVSSAGSGFFKNGELVLNRWKEDSILDQSGHYLYIRDLKSKTYWSNTYQPTLKKADSYKYSFEEDKIEFERMDHLIQTSTEIILSPEDQVELRKITLTNKSDLPREIELTSYLEIVLNLKRDDDAHPAFSKLFIQTEQHQAYPALLAKRRPRSESESEKWAFHQIIRMDGIPITCEYETDRMKFIGRGKDLHLPASLTSKERLSETTGPVLDPIFSIRTTVRIPPNNSITLLYSSGLAKTRDEIETLIMKYNDPGIFNRESSLCWLKSQIFLKHLNIRHDVAHLYQRIATHLIYQIPGSRPSIKILEHLDRNQSALWAYGISGDLPLLLLKLSHEKEIPTLREILHAYEYLRLKGVEFDLLILIENTHSYLKALEDEINRQILLLGCHPFLDKKGGIFIRRADQIQEQDLVLLKAMARINLDGLKGSLEHVLHKNETEKIHTPLLTPNKFPHPSKITHPTKEKLLFYNEFGGFRLDGKAYAIHLHKGCWPPLPWINVISNPVGFGFTISETGQGTTWNMNGRENRLTPWSNDTVIETPAEAIYLRDEATGEYWSLTPLSIDSSAEWRITHYPGHTSMEHTQKGVSHKLSFFCPMNSQLKIINIEIENTHQDQRKLSLTFYIEWILANRKQQSYQTLFPKMDSQLDAIIVTNKYNNEFAHLMGYVAFSIPIKSFSFDRREFLGRNQTFQNPDALKRKYLSRKQSMRSDPCSVLHSEIELPPLSKKTIQIFIGEAQTYEEIAKNLSHFRHGPHIQESLEAVQEYWNEILETFQVETPDHAFNILFNQWLIYQTLSCRYWARTATYQSGGAIGFRDQLQDVMALVFSRPDLTREHLILCASRQFKEGDVQHWWHPPTGRGVRTRFSDDLLWLPFVLSYYLEKTMDDSILHENITFIEGPALLPDQDETYFTPTLSTTSASLYIHAKMTIDRSLAVGIHGLPLMGSGDWNDGMNKVGHKGKGESVWMAWFLASTIKSFIPICEQMGDFKAKEIYQGYLEGLKASVENHAWDGEWYRRAFFDDGTPMGSSLSEECKIDSIAQSWAVLSGLADLERASKSMGAVEKFLVDRDHQMIRLFTPPFNKTLQDPGYIKGYLPGVRENGGQYTHAAIWVVMAFAQLKENQKAYQLLSMLNPINHSRTKKEVEIYQVEPYVMAADIYGVPPHEGRGGWSWYTGSASWMYRTMLESILGLHQVRGKIQMNPCIPKEWDQYKLTYKIKNTVFKIEVNNNQSDSSLHFDGLLMPELEFPILNDGITHHIVVKLKSTNPGP